ncbi:MAG TPA: DUF655 domain-containing protein [Thermoplasmata archaeon]|nr:DUF655 domain-containing protein [Thermoplasmata archaeon]
MEDYAYILDHMPHGRPDSKRFHPSPVTLGIGDREFKILELIPKEDAVIQIGDRVYIGKDLEIRDRIQHVKRRIGYKDLTGAAQSELTYILEQIVKDQEERFIEFINNAHWISTRFHMLEILPGLGKKTLVQLLEERKKGPFKDFADLVGRVPAVRHPEKLIAKRIHQELQDTHQKYKLFVAH